MLPAQKHSIAAREMILDIATDNPYQRASDMLKKLSFIEASPQKISDLIREEGQKLLGEDEGKRRAAFDEFAIFPDEMAKKKFAIVQVDCSRNKRSCNQKLDGYKGGDNIF